MNRVVEGYLRLLPYFSLIGIILSILRTAFQMSYIEYFLLFGACLDLLIVLAGFRCLFQRPMFAVLCLMVFSLVIGLLNNDLSRRFITDFTNPFFFFCKILIFKQYWENSNFNVYIKYYTRVAVVGSLVLLPITYFLFASTGTTRLAIFPPMELPFSYYLAGNSPTIILSLLVIVLYGKRAQLVSALFTFLLYLFFVRRDKILLYIFFAVLACIPAVLFLSAFSENLAIQRLNTTIELYFEEESNDENLNRLSAGRLDEFKTITEEMDLKDYALGKGLGFTYVKNLRDGDKEATNAHFSPLGFLSKYGIVFTFFIYIYLGNIIFKLNTRLFKSKKYLVAAGVCMFVFFESFFAYAIFVTPIFSVALGVMLAETSLLKGRFNNTDLKHKNLIHG
jgi:hypothetical protein